MDEQKKNAILKHLVVKEEDTFARFEELVKKSRTLFHIDAKQKKVVLEQLPYTNAEKICLQLIGRYFGVQGEVFDFEGLRSRQLSDELNIVINTLGSPLVKLEKGGYIYQKESKYFVNHYKVEDILDSLTLKYKNHQKRVTLGLSLTTPFTKNSKSKSLVEAEDEEEETKEELKEKSTAKASKSTKKSASPKKSANVSLIEQDLLDKNIVEFCKQHQIDEDRLRTVIDFQLVGPRLVNFKEDSIRKFTQLKALMLLGGILRYIYCKDTFPAGNLLYASRIPNERLDTLFDNTFYRKYFSIKPMANAELNYAGQKQALKMLLECLEKGTCEL